MQLIILGMHRSGSSAVARLLNMMGAYFAPENMELPATPENPKGYWERRDVVNLNEEVLKHLRLKWDLINDFELNQLDIEQLTPEIHQYFWDKIKEIILKMDANRPWMLKDPRLCLLLPLWQPALELPVYIYIYRDPIQIAQSLAKRDNLPINYGLALWEKYTLLSLQMAGNAPKLCVSYHEVMANPVATVEKLYLQLKDLGIQGLRLPTEKEILAFIDPTLFRQRGNDELQNHYINPQQIFLAHRFRSGEILQKGNLPPLSQGAVEVLAAHKKRIETEQYLIELEKQVTEKEQRLVEYHAVVMNRDAEIAKRDEQLTEYHAVVLNRDAEIAKRDEQLTEYHAVVMNRDAEIAKRDEQLTEYYAVVLNRDAEIAKRDEQLTEYHAIVLNRETEIATRDIKLIEQEKLLTQKIQELMTAEKALQTLQTDLIQQQQKFAKQQQEITKQQQEITKQQQEVIRKQQSIDKQSQQLTQLQQQLTQAQQDLQAANNLRNYYRQQEEYAQKLGGIIYGLHDSISAIFQSLTWRVGHAFTRTVLALTLKKEGLTAKDRIQELFAEASRYSQIAANIPQTAPTPAPSKNLPAPTHKPAETPVITTVLRRDSRDYAAWIKKYDTLTPKIITRMEQVIESWQEKPLISIIMPTYNTPENYLRQAIESVCAQIYPHWELCIADDASPQPHVRTVLTEYAAKDARIKIILRPENGHISAASNSALAIATGEFVTFLDHDDLLAKHALFWVAQDIQQYPQHHLWYSDEDKINDNGERYDPYFKSDWNLDLMLSHNLVTHLAVYRMEIVRKIGGLREGFEGAQDYDLVLRMLDEINQFHIRHIPRVLYHWRAFAGSTALRPEEKPYAQQAAQRAIQAYLDKRGIMAEVLDAPEVRGANRVRYLLPSIPPKVSIIIPTRNAVNLLRVCVDSILNLTDYPDYEILVVNNQSDDPETLNYMADLETTGKVRILDYPYPFNYSDMNNMAVDQAQGEIIGLMNNDMEVTHPEWLRELVGHALRPEVGAVGARLWYPNDTLQHGGVVLGIGGVAGHAHKGFARGDVGYFGRAALIQNFSAVTGACLFCRKQNFISVGGLDAERLTVALNDVDLCLKMIEVGQRIVWTPYADLYHHESATRGYEDTIEKTARFEKERLYMKERWHNFLLLDPAYSPNLTLETQDFAYSWPPRIQLIP